MCARACERAPGWFTDNRVLNNAQDFFPTAANARRRPYEYGNFAKRMGDRYEGALCEIGKEVGIGRETVAKALEKFASKLEKDWGP